jgi:hypothetical protein
MTLNGTTTINSYVTRFENVSNFISTYIFIFYLIFGNIGNIFKVFFFLQKPLKRCPCAIYVLLGTIGHFFTLNNIPLLSILSKDWVIIGFGQSSLFINETRVENSSTPSEYSIKMCKIQNYFHTWSSHFSFQVLLFASINRFFMTTRKKNREENLPGTDFFCSLSTAYIICLFTSILWGLISLHHLFDFTITHNICTSRNTILWATEISSVYISQSILMVIFGTLTILYRQERAIYIRRRCRNHHEMIPLFNQLCQYCRNERSEHHHVEVQLTSMIITEIILVVLTSLPYAIYIVYRLVTEENDRNSMEIRYENTVEKLIRLTLFFEPSCGFYIYIFSLTTLKQRFLNILRQKILIFQTF